MSCTPEESREVLALALPVVEGTGDGEALYEHCLQARGKPPALARAIVEGYARMAGTPLGREWVREARDLLREATT